ncbi:MAG: proton-conducting transporter membrane subunit, partial [bacterium]
GIPLRMQVEPLGMIFAGVASLLWPINSLYSIGYMRGNDEGHQTRYYVSFAVAIASAVGIAYSGNLVTLFVFYEVLTLSTYPLVTHHGDEEARSAGRTYLGILIGTSIGLLLLAIVWTYLVTGTVDFRPGGILAGAVEGPMVGLLLFLYVFGIGKAAVMPVHRWLPAAMVAPTPVSALLHAVAVVKAGVFTVVKVVVYVFGLDLLRETASAQWFLWAAAFTVLVASIVAIRILLSGGNLKRLLAYSTISQLSYIVLAAAILAPLSAVGAALHITAHAFGKITLFFAAGSLYTAAHKTEIWQLDGVGKRMPWTMGAFAIGSLSMIGLPPTGGFVSKWYMLVGAFGAGAWLAVGVLVLSTLLNAGYFVPIVYRAFFRAEPDFAGAHGGGHGNPEHDHEGGGRHGNESDDGHAGHGSGGGHDEDDHHHHVEVDHGEAPWPIVLAVTATAALTVLFFFYPDVVIDLGHAMIGAER